MKKGALFLILFFSVSFCLAFPEIELQHEEYQVQETVFGTISESLTELTRDAFRIFEDRKEVFFERDVLKYNDTYYFYAIFPRSGEFNISFGSVLYNDSGAINSISLNKKVIISSTNSSNGSKILSIKPGFYYGSNPELTLSNYGDSAIEVDYNSEKISLNQYDSKKIKINQPEGFSFAKINSYKNFIVPIVFINLSANTSNTTQNETQSAQNTTNETELRTEINISAQNNITIQSIVNQSKTYYLSIDNFGASLNLTIKSDIPDLQFKESLFLEENRKTDFEISILPSKIGAIVGKIEFYNLDKKLLEVEAQIFIFEDEASEGQFEERVSSNIFQTPDCSNGFLCESGESCDSSTFSAVSGKICCPIKCTSQSSGGSGFFSILIGLLIVGLVGYIGYHFYKKSKNTTSAKVEDKFKEIDSSYQKKFTKN